MVKVSVIIPVYNVEKYLRECMDSLERQTLQDIEFICVNDGSTDHSQSILEEYAARDDRFKILHKPNTGYGHSVNLGINQAVGEYIGILESDDFAKDTMFEQLYHAAAKHNAEVVKSNFIYYESNGGINMHLNEILKDCQYDRIFSPLDDKSIFYTQLTVWSAIYKRSFLVNNNIRFNETPGASYQDIAFSFQVWACAKRVYLLKDAFVYYRQDNLNSSVKSPSKIYCVCDEYRKINQFLDGREDLKKELSTLKTARQFNTYKWNYNRLVSVFQYEFYQQMLKEFIENQVHHAFDKSLWLAEDWNDLQRIIKDPDRYFEETAKDDYRDERMSFYPTMNKFLVKFGLLALIQKYDCTVLYGAGYIGRLVAQALINEGVDKNKIFFAVSDKTGQEDTIMGIPVYRINELIKDSNNCLVLVSTKEKLQFELVSNLMTLEFNNYIIMDSVLLKELVETRR